MYNSDFLANIRPSMLKVEQADELVAIKSGARVLWKCIRPLSGYTNFSRIGMAK